VIRYIDDMKVIASAYRAEQNRYQFTVLVCGGAGCVSSGCAAVKAAVVEAIRQYDLTDTVNVIETGCIGSCAVGPVMLIQPENIFYTELTPKKAAEIVKASFIESCVLEEYTYFDPTIKKHVPLMSNITFFSEQRRIALRNCGRVDYSSIAAYVARDGYVGIAKALGMGRLAVIDEIKRSKLRGRGGAGFPTGLKWEAGYAQPGAVKYIICNADEGDPGAFMDRSLIEGDPHSVIEGIMIGAYAIGAAQGFVYVRAEYPSAVERLGVAIEQARQEGMLGKNILGSGFDFDLEIRIGAGAFVCGEETALMASTQGQRGEPLQKPPFPFQKGLFGHPTIINNVETFACIAPIILKGANWYASIGTEKSRGTKVFALAGNVCNTGIVEVPMGTLLGDLIFKIGGGIPGGKTFKAAQLGGPSGGCLTKEHLGIPLDYESVTQYGAIMGSGGLIVMDNDTCMVDTARYFMDFIKDESCGKCLPCRVGTKRMLEILERITRGKGQPGDIDLLEELAAVIKDTALCGLGQSAPNPVLSTIRNFRNEYEEHIYDKHCVAGVCSDLFIAPCANACPARVNIPGYIALIRSSRPIDAYRLIRQENPFPAICGRICTHPCELKCRRAQLDEALAIYSLKRYAADYAFRNLEEYRSDPVVPKNGKSIGIIGAGPSGLACAHYLTRLGYDVDVYESQPVAGGILAYGIPEYRLPKKVIRQEVKLITDEGVHIHLNTMVGRDTTLDELRSKHDAVYIAVGAQISNKLDVPGEHLPGVIYGLDLLRRVNLGEQVKISGKVAVIGGGNTAIDAARTALRLGAENVAIIYRQTVEDMSAAPREIQECLDEGVHIIALTTPLALTGEDRVTGVQYAHMVVRGYDESGRKLVIPVDGRESNMPADTVIVATGRSTELQFVRPEEARLTRRGTFVTDKKTLMTSMDGVFAGGDAAHGADVAITAIADGKKAAESIDIYLGGDGVLDKGVPIDIPQDRDDEERVVHERFPMRELDPAVRCRNFDEVVTGFHRLDAMAEAMRCLRCDRRQRT
jgi:NADH-quinone oxidoreductase subunit F